MSDVIDNDPQRRRLLIATGVVGGAAAIGAAVPFVGSMVPSERAKAAGAPVEVDINGLASGAIQTVEWRGKPVWIMRRDDAILKDIREDDGLVSDPRSEASKQPDYAKNEYRSIKPEICVLIGVCTHLGCSPQFKPAADTAEMGQEWHGGFYCPCHGSKFDLAGRVIRGSPAPTNLEVPPYAFLDAGKIIVGSDKSTG